MKKVITLLSCLSLCLIGNFLFPAFVSAHPTGAKTSTITTSSHITSHALRPNAGDPSLAGQWPDDPNLGCWDTNARVVNSIKIGAAAWVHPVLVALWFSPDCGTNWADVQILDGAQINIQSRVYKITNNDGGDVQEFGNRYVGNRDWSKMIYSPHDKAVACGDLTPDFELCTDPAV